MQGKKNIAAGFLFLAAFMLYGFVLIYLRDFAPGKEAWIADYAVGKHFESRLAHVHGNLFASSTSSSAICCCGCRSASSQPRASRGSRWPAC